MLASPQMKSVKTEKDIEMGSLHKVLKTIVNTANSYADAIHQTPALTTDMLEY